MRLIDWQSWGTIVGVAVQNQTRWLDTKDLCQIKAIVEFGHTEGAGVLILETSDVPQASVWTTCDTLSADKTVVLTKGLPLDYPLNLQRYLRWRTASTVTAELCFRIQVVIP
jgi:hypothetical protein